MLYPTLLSIHKGLAYCYSNFKKGVQLSYEDVLLDSLFRQAIPLSSLSAQGLDGHLTKGLIKRNKQKSLRLYPRLSKLVVDSFLRVQESKGKRDTYRGIIMPSPLSILYHFLTVPEEPQTAAYAFVSCRSMLFDILNLHPASPALSSISKRLEPFDEEDILNSLVSLKNHIKIQARWPDPRTNSETKDTRIKLLSGHILSIKRYTYLWFRNEDVLFNFLGFKESGNQIDELEGFDLRKSYSNSFGESLRYSFRKSSYYNDIPETAEVNNWIFGVPIPWRGADLLFFGGLKTTSMGGLVISLYGSPGVGKTSTALSLSACLVPFGTQTIYISLEEHPDDLRYRLRSLIPEYLRKMKIFYVPDKDEDKDWFQVVRYSRHTTINGAIDLIKALKEKIDANFEVRLMQSTGTNSMPSVCPLLVVLDNINELFDEKVAYHEIEEFVDYCRSLGAFVVLIAGDNVAHDQKIDYLVDVAVRLKQSSLDNKLEKPVREIQLQKTRNQVSRQGSHVFHLSNATGFRISPQVPSQMDKREKIKLRLPSEEEFIHMLNMVSTGKKIDKQAGDIEKLEQYDFLPIAVNSQILVHGYGSSGKAGFGLKLLLTPTYGKEDNPLNASSEEVSRKTLFRSIHRKVLVISFLYPPDYYEELKRRIDAQFTSNLPQYDVFKAKITVKAFYPGFLTPEDFVNKVVRSLEEARLEGEPFTGVLLDGLHNVFLQFKYLQETHMIWPLLYSILSRYAVTVASTFTNFSLVDVASGGGGSQGSTFEQDRLLMQQGQKPFLHGLVKASDYFFVLDDEAIGDKKEKQHLLSVRSSIRQKPPLEKLIWDRERLTLRRREVADDVNEK